VYGVYGEFGISEMSGFMMAPMWQPLMPLHLARSEGCHVGADGQCSAELKSTTWFRDVFAVWHLGHSWGV
jgi:hypothetical protein